MSRPVRVLVVAAVLLLALWRAPFLHAGQPQAPVKVFLDCESCFADFSAPRSRSSTTSAIAPRRKCTCSSRARETGPRRLRVHPRLHRPRPLRRTSATRSRPSPTSVGYRRHHPAAARDGAARRAAALPHARRRCRRSSSSRSALGTTRQTRAVPVAGDPLEQLGVQPAGLGLVRGRGVEPRSASSAPASAPIASRRTGRSRSAAEIDHEREEFDLDEDEPVSVERRERDFNWLVVKRSRRALVGWRARARSSRPPSTTRSWPIAGGAGGRVQLLSLLACTRGASCARIRRRPVSSFATTRRRCYGKLEETLPTHELSLTLEQRERWGTLEASVEWSQYLHDLSSPGSRPTANSRCASRAACRSPPRSTPRASAISCPSQPAAPRRRSPAAPAPARERLRVQPLLQPHLHLRLDLQQHRQSPIRPVCANPWKPDEQPQVPAHCCNIKPHYRRQTMYRRDFLKQERRRAGGVRVSRATPSSSPATKKRVGLIGSGWYGKSDLFRLIQVAPVEVVSLCDVDKQMLAEAADLVADAAGLEEAAAASTATTARCSRRRTSTSSCRHARPLARPADDRRRRGRGRRLGAEADQRRRRRGPGDARRRPQAQARRAGRHAAPQHAAPDRGPRPRSSRRASSATIGLRRDLLLLPHAGDAEPARRRSRRRTSTTRCGPARRRCGRTTRSSTRAAGARSWSTATASWATCASTCSTWSAGCSTSAGRSASPRPAASSSTRRARRTSPTRRPRRSTSANCTVVWQHRTWGSAPDPKYPVGRDDLRRQGHAQGERQSATTSSRSARARRRCTRTSCIELEQVSRGQDREGPGAARRAGDPRPHEELPRVRSRRAASRSPTSSRATSRRRPASWRTCRCSSAAR